MEATEDLSEHPSFRTLPVESDDDASDSSDAGIVSTSKSRSKENARHSASSTRSDDDSDSDSDSDMDNEEGKVDEIISRDDLESFPKQGRPASHTLVLKSQKKDKRKRKKETAPPPPDRRLNEKRPGVIVTPTGTPSGSQGPTPKTTPALRARQFLRRSGNTGNAHTSPVTVVDGIDARLLGLDINQDLSRVHRGSPRVSSTGEGPPGSSTEPPPPPSDDVLPSPPSSSHSRGASIPPPPPS